MAMSFADRAKGFVSARLLDQVSGMVQKGETDSVAKVFDAISKLAPARYHRETFRELAGKVRRNDPIVAVYRNIFTDLHPNCREKLIMNLMVNFVTLGRGIRDRQESELGIHIPNFMVISPTMRCNLRCKGCYAAEYDPAKELSFDTLDGLLKQAKELGMYFFTFSGGECFVRPDLIDLWEKHSDCYFQVYTNGTLIDDSMADRLVELGNVAPMISVEGGREETDARRGEGVYDKVMGTFARLKKRGVLFGFSSTLTRVSAETLLEDAFIETMSGAGCRAGWFFQYIPTGRAPELEYMATPVQRAELHRKVTDWRTRYPLFLGDFWNDGPFVDGCMAGGERYLHVIANGDVEPCVFCHFAVDNIKDKPLVQIFDSPFFKKIRAVQPYEDDNLLRPCLIIDHPGVLRTIVRDPDVHPTHPGAEGILDELASGLDGYAGEVARLFDPLWENGARDSYLRSLEKEDKPEAHERFNRRKAVRNP